MCDAEVDGTLVRRVADPSAALKKFGDEVRACLARMRVLYVRISLLHPILRVGCSTYIVVYACCIVSGCGCTRACANSSDAVCARAHQSDGAAEGGDGAAAAAGAPAAAAAAAAAPAGLAGSSGMEDTTL
jgi:hypothetical protein